MMQYRTILSSLFGLFLVAGLPAMASAEAPTQIPIQAYLTDSEGVPIDGSVSLQVNIYDSETGGTSLHSEQLDVQSDAGSFTAYLGTNQPVDLSIFRDNEQLYLGIAIDGGEELTPRIRLATAPYAGFAEHAGEADNAQQLAGESPEAYRETDWDDIQNVPESAEASYSGRDPVEVDDQNDEIGLKSSCASDQVLKWNGSQWTCASDESNVYQAGQGLALSNQEFSADPSFLQRRVSQQCSSSEKMVGIQQNGQPICEPDQSNPGTITGVNAGNGLSGGGSSGNVTVDVASGGIGSGEIASNSVGNSELDTDSVSGSEIQTGAVKSDDIDNGTIEGEDIGKYACDGNTQFVEVDYDNTIGSCPFSSKGNDLPNCNEVPVGSLCESDLRCPNAGNVNNCGIYEIFMRTSW